MRMGFVGGKGTRVAVGVGSAVGAGLGVSVTGWSMPGVSVGDGARQAAARPVKSEMSKKMERIRCLLVFTSTPPIVLGYRTV
jgi:hypothetical protein